MPPDNAYPLRAEPPQGRGGPSYEGGFAGQSPYGPAAGHAQPGAAGPGQPPYGHTPSWQPPDGAASSGRPPYEGRPPHEGQPPYEGQLPYEGQPPYGATPPGQGPYGGPPPGGQFPPPGGQFPPHAFGPPPPPPTASNKAGIVVAFFFAGLAVYSVLNAAIGFFVFFAAVNAEGSHNPYVIAGTVILAAVGLVAGIGLCFVRRPWARGLGLGLMVGWALWSIMSAGFCTGLNPDLYT
ncbi:hypothetical protein [Nonomuraea sp. NPDC049309]|uniref:hypothetical protein n=1 Tax=Nonomuraea sp. NPDC049309 TaxID=3364350 RepID=UPI0037158A06